MTDEHQTFGENDGQNEKRDQIARESAGDIGLSSQLPPENRERDEQQDSSVAEPLENVEFSNDESAPEHLSGQDQTAESSREDAEFADEVVPKSFEREAEAESEFASEVAVPDNRANGFSERHRVDRADDVNQNDKTGDVEAGATLGWTAIIFAIASLFFWPALLGPTAAILGYFAYAQGRTTLGGWAIALGLIAFVSSFLLSLFYG
jgi:hypothetical protein